MRLGVGGAGSLDGRLQLTESPPAILGVREMSEVRSKCQPVACCLPLETITEFISDLDGRGHTWSIPLQRPRSSLMVFAPSPRSACQGRSADYRPWRFLYGFGCPFTTGARPRPFEAFAFPPAGTTGFSAGAGAAAISFRAVTSRSVPALVSRVFGRSRTKSGCPTSCSSFSIDE